MCTAATKNEIDASNETIAAAEAQRTRLQTASTTAASGLQSTKKKKPNNRKNQKKKKAAEKAEMSEALQVGDAAPAPTSNMAVKNPVDSNDPFYDQIIEVEEVKRGTQGSAGLRGGHAEAPDLVSPNSYRCVLSL